LICHGGSTEVRSAGFQPARRDAVLWLDRDRLEVVSYEDAGIEQRPRGFAGADVGEDEARLRADAFAQL
jgi:hypothetical protein